ncbi:CDP-alcohol phosphatidyltransferase family protein [Sphingomonas sp. HF-S3]|uniref:CDP-alcohol phosphatidyltransferase family protein n=1 Tax=Sphingomonas rustica TaxID=3103142 RepID=A0ABV0BHR5_9SPHN
MTPPQPDGSRFRRIEDPTNLWIIHPAARALLPWFVARGISANSVSIGGLILGATAALSYAQWHSWPLAVLGLALSVGWLIADGLDGMIARATGTASALGRALDGLCDHGVFILIYVVLAFSMGDTGVWPLVFAAGAAHALQSNLYESERARFHRRIRGVAIGATAPSRNPLVQLYDHIAGGLDRFAGRFDTALGAQRNPAPLADAYRDAATPPMRLMSLLSANMRVYAIFLACIAGDPRWFWWVELGPLTAILLVGLIWHRRVEARLVRQDALHLIPNIEP